jgi:hypothetical protein
MRALMTVLRADGSAQTTDVFMPEEPGFELLDQLIRPLLDGADLEHVSVLHQGARADMFVDEAGRLRGLPRNDVAPAIYRAATMRRAPKTDPETLPYIAGAAVLFDRQVWF